ncbi:MAG: 4Fe-4S binding protein [Methanosarcinaceae archaeon]|nr:4Fe-4S binding protein [Methanosarcinaceae archaeon]
MKIYQTCVGCAQCATFCKTDAIKVKGKAQITDACIECGVCARYCPMKAIEASI